MNEEIKEILDKLEYIKKTNINHPLLNNLSVEEAELILDYITNLQQENERLKKQLDCKEYFSSTMPENTEFVILTKANYDRQQKDIELELIDYKSRCEKAIEYTKKHTDKLCTTIVPKIDFNYKELLNILQGETND